MLLPEKLELPRTIALEFIGMTSKPLELSSRNSVDIRRYKITVYSTLRGDLNDLMEILYAGMHGSGDLLSYPNFSLPSFDNPVFYENHKVKYHKPFKYEDTFVYSASLIFDAVSRSG